MVFLVFFKVHYSNCRCFCGILGVFFNEFTTVTVDVLRGVLGIFFNEFTTVTVDVLRGVLGIFFMSSLQ